MQLDAMLAVLGFSALRAVARALPPRLGHGLSRAGGRLHYHLAAGKRAAVRNNLRRVLSWAGEEPDMPGLERMARHTFQSHGLLLYEWLRDGHGVSVEFEGLDRLERLAGDRGVVITTCHLGNWEVAAMELARRGHALHVVTGEQLGRLGAAVRRHKARHGIHAIRPADGMRNLYRALGRREMVVLLIDGNIYRHGRAAPFFDATTRLPFGAVRLARATGAALVPAAMFRVAPLAYRIRILAPVELGGPDQAIMQAVLRALEPLIAAHPHQWCLFRPLWPTHGRARAA